MQETEPDKACDVAWTGTNGGKKRRGVRARRRAHRAALCSGLSDPSSSPSMADPPLASAGAAASSYAGAADRKNSSSASCSSSSARSPSSSPSSASRPPVAASSRRPSSLKPPSLPRPPSLPAAVETCEAAATGGRGCGREAASGALCGGCGSGCCCAAASDPARLLLRDSGAAAASAAAAGSESPARIFRGRLRRACAAFGEKTHFIQPLRLSFIRDVNHNKIGNSEGKAFFFSSRGSGKKPEHKNRTGGCPSSAADSSLALDGGLGARTLSSFAAPAGPAGDAGWLFAALRSWWSFRTSSTALPTSAAAAAICAAALAMSGDSGAAAAEPPLRARASGDAGPPADSISSGSPGCSSRRRAPPETGPERIARRACSKCQLARASAAGVRGVVRRSVRRWQSRLRRRGEGWFFIGPERLRSDAVGDGLCLPSSSTYDL